MKRLNTGDIALVQVREFSTWYRALLGRLIQWIDCYYHHAILYVDGVFHEADSKVVERPLSHYNGDRLLILELIDPLTEGERRYYECIADDQLDKKYDYWGTLFFQLIYRITAIWFGRKGKAAEERPFCSEHTLTPIHHVRGYFQDKYKWSPGDIMRKGSFYYRIKWEGIFNDKDWV
jgi:hypothetical protein